MEEKVNRGNLVYKTDNYTYTFQQFEIISSFDKNIFNSKSTFNDADED